MPTRRMWRPRSAARRQRPEAPLRAWLVMSVFTVSLARKILR